MAVTHGEWDASTSTGYEHVTLAPQFCFTLAADADVEVVLRPIEGATPWSGAAGISLSEESGYRSTRWPHDRRSDFAYTASSLSLPGLRGGVPYTLIATTYAAAQTGAFEILVKTSVRLAQPLTHLGPLTLEAAQRASAASHISGEWDASTSTGYEHVTLAPQFCFTLAADADVEVVLRPIEGATPWSGAAGISLSEESGYRSTRWPHDRRSDFAYTASSLSLPGLRGGVPYTLIATTYAAAQTGAFEILVNTSVRLSQPLALLTAVTHEEAERRKKAAEAACERAEEVERRKRALEGMRALASASCEGSPARMHWEDFAASIAEVERVRAECRRTKTRFSDGWSGPAAWGRESPVVWVDWSRIAPNPQIVEGGFSIEDVEQGTVGDCYLLSALAGIAGSSQALLDSVFVVSEANAEGVFAVRFWVENAWRTVIIDATFPASPDSHRTFLQPATVWSGAPAEDEFYCTVGSRSLSINEFWVQILEKAWARLHGSYAAIDGAALARAVNPTIVGTRFPLNFFLPHSLPGVYTPVASKHPDALWASLADLSSKGLLLSVGSASSSSSSSSFYTLSASASLKVKGGPAAIPISHGDHRDRDGIVCNHAFSLMRLFGGPPSRFERMVQLRNPWGDGEWVGKYSDTDTASWTLGPGGLCEATGYMPDAVAAAHGLPRKSGGEHDGLFWLPYADFLRKFTSVSIVRPIALVNEAGGSWHKITARGVWTAAQGLAAAAAEASGTEVVELLFDQFRLSFAERGEFNISLHVEGGGLAAAKTSFLPSLFQHTGLREGAASSGLAASDWMSEWDEAAGVYPPPAAQRPSTIKSPCWSTSASPVEDETLDPSAGPILIFARFQPPLPVQECAFILTVVSQTPFSLVRVTGGPRGRVSTEGVRVWSAGTPPAIEGAHAAAPPHPGVTVQDKSAGKARQPPAHPGAPPPSTHRAPMISAAAAPTYRKQAASVSPYDGGSGGSGAQGEEEGGCCNVS